MAEGAPGLFEGCESVSQAVGEAVGAASMCWSDVGSAGEFDSRRAAEVAFALCEYLRTHGVPGGHPDAWPPAPEPASAAVTGLTALSDHVCPLPEDVGGVGVRFGCACGARWKVHRGEWVRS